MAKEQEFKLDKTDAALLKPESESGVNKFLSDAYQWASENKTTLAIGAAALTVAGGAHLLRRAMASGSESAAAELAVANTEKNGLGKSVIPGNLDSQNPYLLFIDEYESATKGRLPLQKAELPDMHPAKIAGNLESHDPVIQHELAHGYWMEQKFPRSMGDETFADWSAVPALSKEDEAKIAEIVAKKLAENQNPAYKEIAEAWAKDSTPLLKKMNSH